MRTRGLVALTLCLSALVAERSFAQSACSAAVERAIRDDRGQFVSLTEVRQRADARIAAYGVSPTPLDACTIGELLRRLGDSSAEFYYREAIFSPNPSAEYFLFYGDYYRKTRGPGTSLVGQAASLYYRGLRLPGADTSVRNRLTRSLIALYERDGYTLANLAATLPRVFFSVQTNGGRTLGALDRVDDVRTLTSGALFAGSPERLGHDLNQFQLVDLIRNAWRGQAIGRMRVRVGRTAVDLGVVQDGGVNGQVATFFTPAKANSSQDRLYQGGVEYLGGHRHFDLFARLDVGGGERKGLIENRPNGPESIVAGAGRVVATRFWGPDKVGFEFTRSYDEITQRVDPAMDRHVSRWGSVFRYQLYRPFFGNRPADQQVVSRGTEFYTGFAQELERFGPVDVRRRDYFAGTALRGLNGGGGHTFDVSAQPTWFSSLQFSRDQVLRPDLRNGQFELFTTVLYRLVDHEDEPNVDLLSPLVTLNAVATGTFGLRQVGPNDYRRQRVGVGLDAKFIGPRLHAATWLLSLQYERQVFVNLDRVEHVVHGALKLGF